MHTAVLCSLSALVEFVCTSIVLWYMEYSVTREELANLSIAVFHDIHVEVSFQLRAFLVDQVHAAEKTYVHLSLLNVCRRSDFERVSQVELAIGVASIRS